MRRTGSGVRVGLASCLLASIGSFARPTLALDSLTDDAAQDGLKRAAADYTASAYARGTARLQKVLVGCHGGRCADATVASVLRDMGAMQFRLKKKKIAAALFSQAVAASPTIDLNPAYDAPDLRAAWEAAGGRPAPHLTTTPAAEQAVRTPIPVFVRGDADGISRVVIHYKSGSMDAWKSVPLDSIGDGWGGAIPCADVTAGTVLYYVDGLGADGKPVTSAGDEGHPYAVTIKTAITGEAPHLPGQAAPAACEDAPASAAHAGSPPAPPNESSEPSEHPSADEPSPVETPPPEPPRAYRRIWVGVTLTVESIHIPAGVDLCREDPSNGLPVNAASIYCTSNGQDFPTRAPSVQNGDLVPTHAGVSDGTFRIGDVRALLSLDYALTANFLVGARAGLVLNRYPGNAAVTDGRAFGPPLHLEARATFLTGHEPLAHPGLALMGFLAGGVSEFDGSLPGVAALNDGTGAPTQRVPIDMWLTNGPWFAAAGAGVRWAFSDSLAATLAGRLNVSFSASAVIPTYGPELGLQLGL